jgi:excisionase family DNA binding protein
MENMGGILTLDEIAEYLKIPKLALYKLAIEGKIPGQKGWRPLALLKASDRQVARGSSQESNEPRMR